MQRLEAPRWGKSRKDKRKRNLHSAKEQGQTAVSSQMFQTYRCDVVGDSKDMSGYCQGEQRLRKFLLQLLLWYLQFLVLFLTLRVLPLLICGVTPGAGPAHIHSASAFVLQKTFPCWIADLHQEIWVPTIASLQENNLPMQWKSVLFFHGTKYENIFPISAAWQSCKSTHITICGNSSFTSSHCGQKPLRTQVLTGRNTTEIYQMSFLFFKSREGRVFWKGLTSAKGEVKVIHCSPLVHKSSHFIIVSNQIVQAWLTLGKPPPILPNYLLLLHGPRNVLQGTLVHDFCRGKSEAGQSVVPDPHSQILVVTLNSPGLPWQYRWRPCG